MSDAGMPEESGTNCEREALFRLALESVVLEQWLRFYWLEEKEGGELRLCVAPEAAAHIAEKAPRLLPLLERLAGGTPGTGDGVAVDARVSCEAVRDFLASRFPASFQAMLESQDFQEAVAGFQVRVAEEAGWLDARKADFTLWMNRLTSLKA